MRSVRDAARGLAAAAFAERRGLPDALAEEVQLRAAGDTVARANDGPLGLTASELIDAARYLINRSIYRAASS